MLSHFAQDIPARRSWAAKKGKTVCVCRSGEEIKCLVYDCELISLRNWQWFFIASRSLAALCVRVSRDAILSQFRSHCAFCVFLWSDTGENEIQLSAVVGAIPLAYILHFALYSLTAKSQTNKKNVWMQKCMMSSQASVVCERAYVLCAVCRLNTPSESHSFSMKIDFSSSFFSPFLRLPFSTEKPGMIIHKLYTQPQKRDEV
jgi:hypothetical protein